MAKNSLTTPLEIRKYAKKFALEAIAVQKKAFQRWGVLADWEAPYLTMNPQYEVEQVKIFKAMFDKVLGTRRGSSRSSSCRRSVSSSAIR